MADRAKVEQSVFDFLRPQLKRYREQSTDLTRATASSISKVAARADGVVTDRRRALRRAQQDLENCLCQEDANCSGFARRVQECEDALQRAIRGRELIELGRARFQHAQNKHTAQVDQLLIRAEKLVRTADERTTNFQKQSTYVPPSTVSAPGYKSSGGGGLSTGGSARSSDVGGFGGGSPGGGSGSSAGGSWRDIPGVSVPESFPAGFALIPISKIANGNPVTGVADFDNGQDVDALQWSSRALVAVVLPAMLKGGTPREYLADRDQREKRSGGQTFVASYDGFFGQHPMKLSPQSDGTFDLINGRHRLWLLENAGATHVPAWIGGGR
ncbi:hypothetical protein [Mycolicibacterium arenosum]|uniref:Uncharacterized protein n=1 Tax=Mycolicibacterium arenosum TaxID=2952157 RepID=A0ABT1M451_9MYCO|nr:hypothetical protein [Mycolicibacterium sp. CAU 1645]MCP9273938.1 hypothetical protein [Mycolicibacterium sp. CAU 1645]